MMQTFYNAQKRTQTFTFPSIFIVTKETCTFFPQEKVPLIINLCEEDAPLRDGEHRRIYRRQRDKYFSFKDTSLFHDVQGN